MAGELRVVPSPDTCSGKQGSAVFLAFSEIWVRRYVRSEIINRQVSPTRRNERDHLPGKGARHFQKHLKPGDGSDKRSMYFHFASHYGNHRQIFQSATGQLLPVRTTRDREVHVRPPRFADTLYLDLLDPERVRLLSARPERLRELVEAEPRSQRVVIDEIQRVPDLLMVVHSLIAARRGLTFILIGSSARKLRRTGLNLLGGRALYRTMHPFMAAELGRRFDLHRAL